MTFIYIYHVKTREAADKLVTDLVASDDNDYIIDYQENRIIVADTDGNGILSVTILPATTD